MIVEIKYRMINDVGSDNKSICEKYEKKFQKTYFPRIQPSYIYEFTLKMPTRLSYKQASRSQGTIDEREFLFVRYL